MSRGITRLAVVGAFVFAASTAAGALADDEGPSTEPVTGVFSAKPVHAKTRTCEGEDGAYLEISGTFAGDIVGSDPRITGSLEFLAHALVNTTTGLGTFEGSFSVRQASGRAGARGAFYTVITEGGLNHGFARGTVGNGPGHGHDAAHPAGHGDEAGDDFFARFDSTVDAALNVNGTFGGAGDARLPAVIQGGRCTGRWTRVP
jgi:hypothetical protein